MYRNILIPVAFDSESDLAKPIEIARTLSAPGGKITLLHVFSTPPSYAMQYVPADLVTATRDGLMASMNAAVKELPNAEAVLMDGAAGRTITDYAHDHDVDLVVMQSHQPGLGDILWGSTAGFVVRHVTCTVHVMR